MPAARIFFQLIADFVVYLGLLVRPRKAIAAENLFLRRQLALSKSAKWTRGESIPRHALRWLCSQGYSTGAMRTLWSNRRCFPGFGFQPEYTHLGLGVKIFPKEMKVDSPLSQWDRGIV